MKFSCSLQKYIHHLDLSLWSSILCRYPVVLKPLSKAALKSCQVSPEHNCWRQLNQLYFKRCTNVYNTSWMLFQLDPSPIWTHHPMIPFCKSVTPVSVEFTHFCSKITNQIGSDVSPRATEIGPCRGSSVTFDIISVHHIFFSVYPHSQENWAV